MQGDPPAKATTPTGAVFLSYASEDAAAAEGSLLLAIAKDMANGTKHLELYAPKVGAYYSFTRINLSGEESRLETVIQIDGIHITASGIAKDCVEEWEKIPTAEGLPVESMGT